jgi:DNA-nicking Smr family endonuclease
MTRRPRLPTASELALWRHAVRDVRPTDEAGLEPPPPDEPAPTAADAPVPAPPPRPSRPALRPGPPPAPGPHNVDRRSWQRLQRGQYPISARLDLHGLTQAQAHEQLTQFLEAQHARGARCILVITGRGARSGGILRALTPRWLEAPRLAPMVLAYAPARIGHGGDGALYVLLRRSRQPGY